MPGYVHPKWYYQLAENLRVYLQAKNQLHSPHFFGDIAKICKLVILGTLGMSVKNFDIYLHDRNKSHHSLHFWEQFE